MRTSPYASTQGRWVLEGRASMINYYSLDYFTVAERYRTLVDALPKLRIAIGGGTFGDPEYVDGEFYTVQTEGRITRLFRNEDLVREVGWVDTIGDIKNPYGVCQPPIVYSYDFKDGKEDGMYRCFYNNRKMCCEHFYVDGKPDGTWKNWRSNGRLFTVDTYKDGVRDGYSATFYDTDTNGPECEKEYKSGKVVEIKRYYWDGTLKEDQYSFEISKL